MGYLPQSVQLNRHTRLKRLHYAARRICPYTAAFTCRYPGGCQPWKPPSMGLRLCRGGERPPDRCAAEKCDELTPPHTPPIRQKTFRKQTESLQRRERTAVSRCN